MGYLEKKTGYQICYLQRERVQRTMLGQEKEQDKEVTSHFPLKFY